MVESPNIKRESTCQQSLESFGKLEPNNAYILGSSCILWGTKVVSSGCLFSLEVFRKRGNEGKKTTSAVSALQTVIYQNLQICSLLTYLPGDSRQGSQFMQNLKTETADQVWGCLWCTMERTSRKNCMWSHDSCKRWITSKTSLQKCVRYVHIEISLWEISICHTRTQLLTVNDWFQNTTLHYNFFFLILSRL